MYIYIYIYIYVCIYVYIYIYREVMKKIQCTQSSSSPQWLCGAMPVMDDQWRSSRIVSDRTNRVLKNH